MNRYRKRWIRKIQRRVRIAFLRFWSIDSTSIQFECFEELYFLDALCDFALDIIGYNIHHGRFIVRYPLSEIRQMIRSIPRLFHPDHQLPDIPMYCVKVDRNKHRLTAKGLFCSLCVHGFEGKDIIVSNREYYRYFCIHPHASALNKQRLRAILLL